MLALEIDLKDLAKLKDLPTKIFNRGFFEELGQYMVSSTQRKIKEGIGPPNAPLTMALKQGRLTLRDTGRLFSSIAYKATDHSAIVGTNVIYGRIQQLGGIIKPKKAKKLWVPASAETKKLMRRFGNTPSALVQGLKGAGYRIWKAKSGKAILASKKKGKPFVLFILKDEVTIPARKYLAVDAIDEKIIANKVERWLKNS